MRIRITSDGIIRERRDDDIDWPSLGRVSERRASPVEFCDRRQMRYVRAGKPRNRLRRILQLVLHRPFGEIVHWAGTRQEALAREREHVGVGGPGWESLKGCVVCYKTILHTTAAVPPRGCVGPKVAR